jgi:hypothetical protein
MCSRLLANLDASQTNQPITKETKKKHNKRTKELQMGISFLACLSCSHRRPNDMKFQVQKKTQLQNNTNNK